MQKCDVDLRPDSSEIAKHTAERYTQFTNTKLIIVCLVLLHFSHDEFTNNTNFNNKDTVTAKKEGHIRYAIYSQVQCTRLLNTYISKAPDTPNRDRVTTFYAKKSPLH